MELKEEQSEQIVEWFRKTFPNHARCEFCLDPESGYKIVPFIFGLPILKTDPEKSVCALLLLSCYKCGNHKFFNAAWLEQQGCPGINILPAKPKKNVLSFFDYFKRKK